MGTSSRAASIFPPNPKCVCSAFCRDFYEENKKKTSPHARVSFPVKSTVAFTALRSKENFHFGELASASEIAAALLHSPPAPNQLHSGHCDSLLEPWKVHAGNQPLPPATTATCGNLRQHPAPPSTSCTPFTRPPGKRQFPVRRIENLVRTGKHRAGNPFPVSFAVSWSPAHRTRPTSS